MPNPFCAYIQCVPYTLWPRHFARVAACGESEPPDLEQVNDRIGELEALIRLLLEERVGQARG